MHHRALNIQRLHTTCIKTVSPVERMNITFVPGVNMVVRSSSISAKVSKISCQEAKGYKWQCLTTQSPTQPHSELQQKNFVDQVTVLHPPLGKDKGWGRTMGLGEGVDKQS